MPRTHGTEGWTQSCRPSVVLISLMWAISDPMLHFKRIAIFGHLLVRGTWGGCTGGAAQSLLHLNYSEFSKIKKKFSNILIYKVVRPLLLPSLASSDHLLPLEHNRGLASLCGSQLLFHLHRREQHRWGHTAWTWLWSNVIMSNLQDFSNVALVYEDDEVVEVQKVIVADISK